MKVAEDFGTSGSRRVHGVDDRTLENTVNELTGEVRRLPDHLPLRQWNSRRGSPIKRLLNRAVIKITSRRHKLLLFRFVHVPFAAGRRVLPLRQLLRASLTQVKENNFYEYVSHRDSPSF